MLYPVKQCLVSVRKVYSPLNSVQSPLDMFYPSDQNKSWELSRHEMTQVKFKQLNSGNSSQNKTQQETNRIKSYQYIVRYWTASRFWKRANAQRTQQMANLQVVSWAGNTRADVQGSMDS